MGDTSIQSMFGMEKERDFSWRQLAVGRWGTNSPHQPHLYLIINIINPECVCGGRGGGRRCTFRVFFPAHSMQKRLACWSQLQNSLGLCRRPWMTFKSGRRINKKSNSATLMLPIPPGSLPQLKSHLILTVLV